MGGPGARSSHRGGGRGRSSAEGARGTIDLTIDDDDDDEDSPNIHQPPQKRAKKNAQQGVSNTSVAAPATTITAEDLSRQVGAAVAAAAAAAAAAGAGAGDGGAAVTMRAGGRPSSSTDVSRAVNLLERLEKTHVTVELLAETEAGKKIKKLSKQRGPGVDKGVAAAASAVVSAWKKMVTLSS